ncbi:hypothetical protein [Pseudomonas jinjuensis]|uniref:Lipopolysaccharide biosynthesis regulator YciM, contains six TPR domains and a predicted metal-binding C-terminal domain n=1 Tax=Pseudomonas jinjuensis TaxID=198616 RepID=A0A1G9YG72_9PSED|nr:hypothetical protein [Pseudomonas jinjuensis]SDN08030.1 Lipopolysaccharide biosynthesis regulator YciM, contains six TPR domains and a predicted metal-binding C-terminal domain [Pseudomonas jinjuensis]
MPGVLGGVLFLLALLVGWWMGRRSRRYPGQDSSQALRERIRRIHEVLDKQPDEELARLSQGLALTGETLTSHAQIGNLYRRRGDIESAIQIHQELLDKVGNDLAEIARLRLELARDFLAAGLVDRAEQLLDEVARSEEPSVSFAALEELRRICEREKDWSRAIELTERLTESNPKLKSTLANYCCELAQEKSREKPEMARDLLLQARRTDPHCIRAVLMCLDLELGVRNLNAAAALLNELVRNKEGFIREMVPILARHDAQGDPAVLGLLRRLAEESGASPSLLALLARLDATNADRWQARLLERVREQPSWPGMIGCLDVSEGADGDPAFFPNIRPIISALHKGMPRYRCTGCGFFGRELHWQCPGCHAWDTLRPLTSPW